MAVTYLCKRLEGGGKKYWGNQSHMIKEINLTGTNKKMLILGNIQVFRSKICFKRFALHTGAVHTEECQQYQQHCLESEVR